MENNTKTLTLASLVLISVEEHIYTSFLSSPASMRTFYADTEEKRKQVLSDATWAFGLSLIVSGLAAWGIKDARLFFIGALGAGGFFYLLLKKGNILP